MSANETGSGVANGDRPVQLADGGDAAIEAASETNTEQLHDWLREDGTDGDLELLYSSSRDGSSAAAFHSKCDGRGATLTVVETTDGRVVGGYTNTPWSSSGGRQSANRAFLFALRGAGLPGPIRLRLKDRNDGWAIWHHPSYGPYFGGGSDLFVHTNMTKVYSNNLGGTYEGSSSWPLKRAVEYAVKEVEVFGVSSA